ncbi:hypothetical protein [Negadavirga shengliensis]|uniref:Uncharacterized protein n=1 Tax=Negadavirga shengliensis TaxID=1389218 RepID=A0ABV9T6S6_9BACT
MSHPFEQVAKRFVKPSGKRTQAGAGAVVLQVGSIAAGCVMAAPAERATLRACKWNDERNETGRIGSTSVQRQKGYPCLDTPGREC